MRLLIAAVVATSVAAGLAAQTPPNQQKPTFKVGVNFVRVDVYPTSDGRIVPDLKQDDFQVLEDGVLQRIETFERVIIRVPGPESERAEPRTVIESNQAASDARNRLFVLFLDTYHTSVDATTTNVTAGVIGGGTSGRRSQQSSTSNSRIGRALAKFLQQLIGPDDLVALMRPEMPVDALTFTRRPSSFEDLLLTGGEWQRRFVVEDLDNTEREYQACYPDESGVVAAMIARRRERLVLDALRNLVQHLQALREERKAILVVSEGWRLFTPDDSLMLRGNGRVPGAPPIGIAGGKPTLGDPREGVTRANCDRDRMVLAQIDDERDFRQMLDDANRANASFYPIDPRGLAVFDTPMGPQPPLGPVADAQALRGRLDSLQTLANATDGIAIINSNDFGKNLHRITDDLSSYYLLGYYSTNAKPDGKFRAITVRVKRPGVTVRARRGYRAPTEAELKANDTANTPPDPEALALQAALAALDRGRPERVILLRGAYTWPAQSAPSHVAFLWVVVELDPAAARQPGWLEGGQLSASILDLDGRTLAAGTGKISPSARTCLIRFADTPLPAGDYLARVKAQWSVLTTTEQVRIKVPDVSAAAASVLGQPIVFRRGPYTGSGFQPTADLRFRRAERIRVDVPLAAAVESVAAQLLDRKGQPLSVPVTTGQREDGGQRFVTAELALAPLAPADYVIEVSVRRGDKTEKALTALRIVP
jgi:VWFA-related protein